jgi:hypothetical protein
MKFSDKGVLFLAWFLFFFTARAEALWVHLDEAQRGEAMYYGARNINTDPKVFFKEWTFDKGEKGVVILNSEFLTLASAARDAAQSGEEMDSNAIEDSLAKAQGKLVFTVYLYGKEKDFARDFIALIKAGRKIFPATYSEDGENAPSENHPGMFVQELFYYFPVGEISPESLIILEIGDPKQKEKLQFEMDLKKVK